MLFDLISISSFLVILLVIKATHPVTILLSSFSGTTITFTASAVHGLATGDRVSISGTTNFNDDNLASQAVTVSNVNTFTMTRSSSSSATNETGTFSSLFVDNGIRITYHSK